MDIIIDIVKEWWHLIGDILFDIFVTCLWILISFKIIYELYVWLFSKPKSKIAYEFGHQ